MVTFAQRLKELREKNGLTQKKLANALNYTRTTISNYECGKRLPDIGILCHLAHFFNVSTDYLLGCSNEKMSFFQQIRHEKSIIDFIVNPEDASFVDCNLSAIEFFGYPKEKLLTMKVYETTIFSKEKIMNDIKEVLKKRQGIIFSQHVTAKGMVKDVKVTINPFKVKDKTLLYCIIDDITPYLNENRKLYNTLSEFTEVMGQLCLNKFCYKQNHQKKVAQIAIAIGEKMEFAREQISLLKMSGLLHDLGEIYIPDEIYNKPSELTIIEYNIVKKHPVHAYDLLKNIEYFKKPANIILQHHERIDGSGYPDGLKGNQIIMEAKIIAVADVIEALTSERSYRRAFKVEQALKILTAEKGKKYASEVVDACIQVFKK